MTRIERPLRDAPDRPRRPNAPNRNPSGGSASWAAPSTRRTSATCGSPPLRPTRSGLDRVLFMPAGQPPHKGDRLVSRSTDRLLMTTLAIQHDPAFELCPIEMERPGASYTIDSIAELKRTYPEAQLFLVMAADSLEQIDTWREPDRLLAEVEWAVGPRPGSRLPDRSMLEDRFGASADAHPPARRAGARRQQLGHPPPRGGRAHHPVPCASRGGGADPATSPLPSWLNSPPRSRRSWSNAWRFRPMPPSWRIGSWRSPPTRRATTS